jgi:hypothetical protein
MKRNHIITITISRAGRIPNFAKVLKNASLFWGCKVWENAQNSLKKLTCNGKNYSEKQKISLKVSWVYYNVIHQCGINPSEGSCLFTVYWLPKTYIKNYVKLKKKPVLKLSLRHGGAHL